MNKIITNIIFLIQLCIASLYCYAQGENDNLVFGNNDGLNLANIYFFSSNVKPTYASNAAISDSLGNLLFYTDGAQVFNKQHQVMNSGILRNYPTLFTIPSNPWGYQYPMDYHSRFNSFIFPYPSHAGLYYVLTEIDSLYLNDQTWPYIVESKLYYSVVDINLNGGLGEVIQKNILLDTNVNVIGVANADDCEDYWLIYKKGDSNFCTRKVTSDTFENPQFFAPYYDDTLFNVESDHHSFYSTYRLSNTYNYGYILYGYYNHDIGFAFINFDNLTGSLSHYRHYPFNKNYVGTNIDSVFLTSFPCLTPSGDNLFFSIGTPINGNGYMMQLRLDNFFQTGNTNTGDYSDLYPKHNLDWGMAGFTSDYLRNKVYTYNITDQPSKNELYSIENPDAEGLSSDLKYLGEIIPTLDFAFYNSILGNRVISSAYNHQSYSPPVELQFCEGDSVVLKRTASGNTWWNTNKYADSITVNQSGIYVAKTFSSCSITVDSYYVEMLPTKVTIIPQDTVVCTANQHYLGLKAIGNTNNVFWNTGEQTDSITVNNSGNYTVTAETLGCGLYKDSVNVFFNPDCHCMPLVPTAFTPNGDGLNDEIEIISQCQKKHMELLLYNRYGQQVYHIYQSNQSWNGTINGKPAPADVYYYILTYETFDGQRFQKKGDITLIR